MDLPRRVKDMTGMRLGRITVLEYAGTDKFQMATWKCRCDCGKVWNCRSTSLRYKPKSGEPKSCGCVRSARFKTHGLSSEYPESMQAFGNMLNRCNNPKSKHYRYYGGRGIRVCDRWNGRDKFPQFVEDMGERPKGLTLDRIDCDGDYSPENCRWATPKTQRLNRSSEASGVGAIDWITFRGETLCRRDMAAKHGINEGTLKSRIHEMGWSLERALTTPSTHPNRGRGKLPVPIEEILEKRGSGMTLQEIADEFGVSRRTIRRRLSHATA